MAQLEIYDVTKDFGGLIALRDVSFKVDKGEIVGIIGPNGAGKSTLFNIITGIEKPTSGRVVFEGVDITGNKPHEILKLGISRTFQSVRPFMDFTVEDNIRIGALYGRDDGRSVDEKVESILSFTGLAEKRKAIVSSLPIEQRKMVEFGKAIASSPKLLLLDEPMAGLNPTEMTSFLEIIRKVNSQGITVLIVEHVMRAIMGVSDRIIVLSAGTKLAEGEPNSILENKDVIEVYLGEKYVKY